MKRLKYTSLKRCPQLHARVTNIMMETSRPSSVQMSTGTCTTLEDFQRKKKDFQRKSLRIISTTTEYYCEIEDRKKTL